MSNSSDESPYWLNTKVDIAYTLSALQKSRTIMTARMEAGGISFVAVVLEVHAEKNYLLLDAPANDKDKARIEAGKSLSLDGSMDGARIAFKSESPELTSLAGQAAIRLDLPQRVLKVQRRAYYRASIPFRRPITCSVPLLDKSVLACQVLDIGLGGDRLVRARRLPGVRRGKDLQGMPDRSSRGREHGRVHPDSTRLRAKPGQQEFSAQVRLRIHGTTQLPGNRDSALRATTRTRAPRRGGE